MTEEKRKPREKSRGTITNARLIKMPRGDVTYPAVIFAGDIPAKGEAISVTLENGVTYTGTVHDATEADGEVLAELTNGLTPTTKP